jgi:hypothetical protein
MTTRVGMAVSEELGGHRAATVHVFKILYLRLTLYLISDNET